MRAILSKIIYANDPIYPVKKAFKPNKEVVEQGKGCLRTPLLFYPNPIYFLPISTLTTIATSSLTVTPPESRVLFHDTP
jgi:hypothetical protein